MSSPFCPPQTTVYNPDVRSSTSMLDNITSIGCISSRADEALQKLDEHIRTLLNILLERSPETLYGILEYLGAKDNNDKDNYNLAQRVAKMIAIAKKRVTKVFSKLRKVPQAASGHQPKAVKELFEELKTISLEFRRHIDDNSEPNDKYEVALQVRRAIVFVNVQYANGFGSYLPRTL